MTAEPRVRVIGRVGGSSQGSHMVVGLWTVSHRRVGSSRTDQGSESPPQVLPHTEPSESLASRERPQLGGWHLEILTQSQPHLVAVLPDPQGEAEPLASSEATSWGV